MKTLALLLVLAFTASAAPNGDVTLAWTPTQPASNIVLYVLRGSPVLSGNPTNWPVLTTVPSTTTQTVVRIQPGAFFFVCQSSNLWGLSDPSNVASTPALPLPPLLSIKSAD